MQSSSKLALKFNYNYSSELLDIDYTATEPTPLEISIYHNSGIKLHQLNICKPRTLSLLNSPKGHYFIRYEQQQYSGVWRFQKI